MRFILTNYGKVALHTIRNSWFKITSVSEILLGAKKVNIMASSWRGISKVSAATVGVANAVLLISFVMVSIAIAEPF